jgi:hypothetical protein
MPISNERRWPSHVQPQRQPYYQRPERPEPLPARPPEDTLESHELQIERKRFLVVLKENSRGRFLRIVEDPGGRSNSIIIPAPGLRDFQKLLDEMVAADREIPAASQPPQPPNDPGADTLNR